MTIERPTFRNIINIHASASAESATNRENNYEALQAAVKEESIGLHKFSDI